MILLKLLIGCGIALSLLGLYVLGDYLLYPRGKTTITEREVKSIDEAIELLMNNKDRFGIDTYTLTVNGVVSKTFRKKEYLKYLLEQKELLTKADAKANKVATKIMSAIIRKRKFANRAAAAVKASKGIIPTVDQIYEYAIDVMAEFENHIETYPEERFPFRILEGIKWERAKQLGFNTQFIVLVSDVDLIEFLPAEFQEPSMVINGLYMQADIILSLDAVFEHYVGKTYRFKDLWHNEIEKDVTVVSAAWDGGECIDLIIEVEEGFLCEREDAFLQGFIELTGFKDADYTEIGAMEKGVIKIAPFGW